MPTLASLVGWQDLELMLRIGAAFLLGGFIGWERERINRPAGFRTHMLVAAGAACFTVASAYAFSGVSAVRDPTRIAAQIVTGVGFLGAGTIFRTPSTVRGLTTAASIWLVAAIGMLAGAGLYVLAIFTTMLGFAALHWLRPLRDRRHAGEPSIVAEDNDLESNQDS